MTPCPLVILRWHDAHAGGHEQYDVASVPHAPLVIETVGWLLRDDEAGVSVASEMLEGGNYRAYTFVPRGMVVKVVPIIKPRAKRAKKEKPVEALHSDQL
jgi:hypothetical protein